MAGTTGRAVRVGYAEMRHAKWSNSERAIARKAFDQALHQELDEVMEKAKRLVSKMKKPADVWMLEDYLRERRTAIERKYDYKYSVLPIVFGQLIYEGRLGMADLKGLAEGKLDYIRRESGSRD
jgi:hypothetical protein